MGTAAPHGQGQGLQPTGTASSKESRSKAIGDMKSMHGQTHTRILFLGSTETVSPLLSASEVGKHTRARFCLQEGQRGILPLTSVQTNSAQHQNNQLGGI